VGGKAGGWVAELDGEPITMAYARELLERLGYLPCSRPSGGSPPTGAPPGVGLQTPEGCSTRFVLADAADGRLLAVATETELRGAVRRGCAQHPDDHGQPGTGCGCPAVGPPPDVDRYRPTPAQERFVRTRDRACRLPGCANRSGWSDLDHVIAHTEGGATSCGNLCLSFPRFLGDPDAWSGGQAERGPPMPRSPLKYPLEVRQRAVEMVQTSGRPIASVAQELGLNPETLRKWVKAKEAAGKVPADELATPAEKDAEIRRLRAEMVELRRTNEILRAASAYFAQELGPARRSETSR
jgi:transposase-like protein